MGRDTLSLSVVEVVLEAYKRPFTISSNFARGWKEEVAEAASLGLITVYRPEFDHNNAEVGLPKYTITDHTWRVTPRGLAAILDTGENH